MGADAGWKRFPPGGHLLVPLDSGAAAAAALALDPSCRRPAAAARRAAAAWARVFGARALPGHAEQWVPPLGTEAWEALLARLREEVGPFDAVAARERPQPDRPGAALLLLAGDRPAAFVKLVPAPGGELAREREALLLVAAFAPELFAAPAPLAWGSAAGWEWLATSAFGGFHRAPRHPAVREIAAEVRRALRGLPRPRPLPGHWLPMHGDFTPWNLRERAEGGLVLYDWERARWGPPGADEVLYRVAAAALRGRTDRAAGDAWPEAARYWAARLRARVPAGEREARLLALQLRSLEPAEEAT